MTRRESHYLKTVSGGAIPRSVCCAAAVKAEGKDVVWSYLHTINCGSPGELTTEHSGKGLPAFWHSMYGLSREYPGTLVVLCHAVEQLTTLGFWDLLEENLWELSSDGEETADKDEGKSKGGWSGVAVLENPPTIVVCRRSGQKRTLKIIDACNYGTAGWSELYAGPMPSGDATAEANVKAYALSLFMQEMIASIISYRLGSLKLTAASQAMHAYRHRFLDKLVLSHDNYPAIGLERQSLYGGRNECFTVGKAKGIVYHLDFNSFYPACVMGEQIPARLRGFALGCKPDPRELSNAGFAVIAEVTVDAQLPRYPLRFSRDRHARFNLSSDGQSSTAFTRNGDLVYPVGRFATALCGPELSVAYAHEEIKRVHSVAWYEPAELFTQWSAELNRLELDDTAQSSRAIRSWVKRMRNALFGKFSQWRWSWHPNHNLPTDGPYKLWWGECPETKLAIRCRTVGWSGWVEKREGESHESCPAITAWVYSLARVKLLQAIECAGWDNVHYTDTDSLWVNHKGYAALKADGWLSDVLPGKLKLNGMHKDVTFHGLKTYTFDGINVHAGIPPGAELQSESGWIYYAPEGVKSALTNGRQPGERIVRHRVHHKGHYRHGIVTVGGRVVPFTLGEE